jgi:hypothetical protein
MEFSYLVNLFVRVECLIRESLPLLRKVAFLMIWRVSGIINVITKGAVLP